MSREQLHDEVHIWTLCPESVREPERLAQFEKVLSAGELSRFRRFRVPRAAHRYLVSHAMLRGVLSRYAEITPHRWQFDYGPHGRPEIANPGAPPLRFNLTHTEGLTACVVSLGRSCGIDAERLSERHAPGRIARKMFSTEECRELDRLSGHARLEYFYERWTLREAYVKALGVGLSFPTRKLAFRIDAAGSIGVSFAADVDDDDGRWHFRLHRPTVEHVLAVALGRDGVNLPPMRIRDYRFHGAPPGEEA
jgi:4'-phosphopantetheinyl transferase